MLLIDKTQIMVKFFITGLNLHHNFQNFYRNTGLKFTFQMKRATFLWVQPEKKQLETIIALNFNMQQKLQNETLFMNEHVISVVELRTNLIITHKPQHFSLA